jgi:hypothetical protein
VSPTAPTANDLIIETQGLLKSWSLNAEQVTTLSAGIANNALTFVVTDTASATLGISSGIVEIGEELILVSSIADDGTCTVPPWGRGYLGTVAAAHNTGDLVTSQPAFPRQKVFDAINETISRVFPKLFAERAASFTVTVPSVTYDLPDDAVRLLDARWQVSGAAKYWKGIRKMRMGPAGGTTVSGGVTGPFTNVSVDIADPMQPGRPLVITYAAQPARFTAVADDYQTVTGLPATSKDVLVYGAASALTVSSELSRLQIASIEQQDRTKLVAPSAALTSSRFLDQRYGDRLNEEATALREKYPVRVMGVWI